MMMQWQPKQWIKLHKAPKGTFMATKLTSRNILKAHLELIIFTCKGCSTSGRSSRRCQSSRPSASSFRRRGGSRWQTVQPWGKRAKLIREGLSQPWLLMTKLSQHFKWILVTKSRIAPTTTDLFKLMHPEDAPGVPPMASHLEVGWEKGKF